MEFLELLLNYGTKTVLGNILFIACPLAFGVLVAAVGRWDTFSAFLLTMTLGTLSSSLSIYAVYVRLTAAGMSENSAWELGLLLSFLLMILGIVAFQLPSFLKVRKGIQKRKEAERAQFNERYRVNNKQF